MNISFWIATLLTSGLGGALEDPAKRGTTRLLREPTVRQALQCHAEENDRGVHLRP